MRGLLRYLAAVALACCILSSSGLPLPAQEQEARESPASVQYWQSASLKPGLLEGRVLYTDGKTPAVEVPVRVWSAEQEAFTQATLTDQQGAYRLSELVEGRYLVVFADRVYMDLRVDQDAALGGVPLNVIIPRGQALFAQMALESQAAVLAVLAQDGGEEAGPPNAPEVAGSPLPTVLIYAGGAATAVGVVYAVEDALDDSDHHVSP